MRALNTFLPAITKTLSNPPAHVPRGTPPMKPYILSKIIPMYSAKKGIKNEVTVASVIVNQRGKEKMLITDASARTNLFMVKAM